MMTSWWLQDGCCPWQCWPCNRSHWPFHDAYKVFNVPCVLLNMFLADLLKSTMLSFSMYTCSASYSLHPKYQVSHIKSTYYTWPGLFGDGPEALICNLRIFLSDLVEKCPEVSYYVPPQLGGWNLVYGPSDIYILIIHWVFPWPTTFVIPKKVVK